MHLMDIHSHILPGVDDGAKTVEDSITLLEMMAEQGITDVIATPHFYASEQNIEDFFEKIDTAKEQVLQAVGKKKLPTLHIGSEVHFFKGIGRSSGIKALSLGNSRYILLELRNDTIDKDVIKDIHGIIYDIGMIPIFAHIERYASERGFKELLKLIAEGEGYGQINAASLLYPPFKRITHRLIKKGYVSFIATDSHSVDARPPLLKAALTEVRKSFGDDYAETFIKNTDFLFGKVI